MEDKSYDETIISIGRYEKHPDTKKIGLVFRRECIPQLEIAFKKFGRLAVQHIIEDIQANGEAWR